MIRAVRLLAAAAVAALAAVAAVGPPPPAAAASPAPASVQLVSQSPWLEGRGTFAFRVAVSGAASKDRLEVTVYDQLITRTAFDQAAAGHVYDGYFYQNVVPLSTLHPDAAGAVSVSLPVNQAAAADDPFPTVQIGETGVFPVQMQIADPSGRPVGQPLTTFIVFAQQTASAGAPHPLAAAVIVPFSSSEVQPPSPEEAGRLEGLATTLNADSSVPASVLASPATLDALAAGATAADRTTLAQLAASTAGAHEPIEVLPSTYSAVSLGDLIEAAGLPGEAQRQVDAGNRTLASVFGTEVTPHTWVIDGPLDAATFAALAARHATQLIVPASDLTPLSSEITTTFARSTYLSVGGTQMKVVAADPGLTADFTAALPPVLAANHLLAELAMVYTETPGIVSRGLAVLPPPGWVADPAFVSTLLGGLLGNPLVSAVSASDLFQAVGDPQGTRYLADPNPNVVLPPGYDGIASARDDVERMRAILPTQSLEVAAADRDLLLAESESVTPAQRRSLLAAVARITGRVAHAATLPPSTTITLTATVGSVPITILTAGNLHPTVDLVLTSQRLIFRAFSPPGGKCVVVSETREVCTLTLRSQNTTLKVPVETRSSGVFPIDVYLYPPGSPSGGRWLAHDQDTVRSTAVSGVALFLIGAALLALIVWWGRDLRRGRRPKGMVPAPSEPDAVGDADLEEFFRQPPPRFGSDGMSPSGAPSGPIGTTDQYGPGRETRG